jgi:hypothetical protein
VFTRVVAERIGIIIVSAFIAHTAWHWMMDRGKALSGYDFAIPAMDAAFAVSAMRGAIVLLIAGAAVWLFRSALAMFSPDLRNPGKTP